MIHLSLVSVLGNHYLVYSEPILYVQMVFIWSTSHLYYFFFIAIRVESFSFSEDCLIYYLAEDSLIILDSSVLFITCYLVVLDWPIHILFNTFQVLNFTLFGFTYCRLYILLWVTLVVIFIGFNIVSRKLIRLWSFHPILGFEPMSPGILQTLGCNSTKHPWGHMFHSSGGSGVLLLLTTN